MRVLLANQNRGNITSFNIHNLKLLHGMSENQLTEPFTVSRKQS